MLEFVGDWLGNTFVALIYFFGFLVCPGPIFLGLWVILTAKGPEKVVTRMPLESIPGQYIVMTVLVGALGWGLFQASAPKEPKEAQRPRKPSQTPLQQCISGVILPLEFPREVQKTLRVLRFEQKEAEIDLRARHEKQSRMVQFMVMEGELTTDKIIATQSAQFDETMNFRKYRDQQWEVACREATFRAGLAAPPPSSATPAEP